jgi:hypothetical protein
MERKVPWTMPKPPSGRRALHDDAKTLHSADRCLRTGIAGDDGVVVNEERRIPTGANLWRL